MPSSVATRPPPRGPDVFTGLVQAVGTVAGRSPAEGGIGFRVRAPGWAEGLEPGESVSVDGVCQTVTAAEGEVFAFESIGTTLSRTTFRSYEPGRRVNLERALRAGDRLGGHFVQGHVDGVGTVRAVEPAGETVLLRLALPEEVAELTVPRGSLAVDGVSLTVAGLEGGVAELAIIPYTWSHTALSRLRAGDAVNLEADLIAKVVRKLVGPALDGIAARTKGRDAAEPTQGGD